MDGRGGSTGGGTEKVLVQTDVSVKPIYTDEERVRALIPEGRAPYALARAALEANKPVPRGILTGRAIVMLAQSQEAGRLEPPLSPELEAAIFETATVLGSDGQPLYGVNDFNEEIALGILDAVFEHGYKSS
jgi:hypothetical protein